MDTPTQTRLALSPLTEPAGMPGGLTLECHPTCSPCTAWSPQWLSTPSCTSLDPELQASLKCRRK